MAETLHGREPGLTSTFSSVGQDLGLFAQYLLLTASVSPPVRSSPSPPPATLGFIGTLASGSTLRLGCESWQLLSVGGRIVCLLFRDPWVREKWVAVINCADLDPHNTITLT